nr:DnaJ domain-containing protein [Govania unica]
MSTDEIDQFQREVPGWHRPTWKLGRLGPTAETTEAHDPLDIFGDDIRKGRGPFAERPQTAQFAPGNRPLSAAEREALATLGLDMQATKADIKKAYKLLVKQYHPDANGGDRQREDMFRSISDAYRKLAAAWESRG